MASPFFRSIVDPTKTFGQNDLAFLKGFNSAGKGLGVAGSALSILGAVSSSVDFFSQLDKVGKPDASMQGMTGTERASYNKRKETQLTYQGINMGLQILSSILSFV